MPTLPLGTSQGSHSTANRRISACPIQRIYPWLLFASTGVAAIFCLAYITKPFINAAPSVLPSSVNLEVATENNKPVPPVEKLIPSGNSLPGEGGQAAKQSPLSPAAKTSPTSATASDFEETNIRIQHVLDAESTTGDLSRIVIDVPVLYQSRNLHWTQKEAGKARELLARLTSYQEKSRELRDEGTQLLSDWNTLMADSIPLQVLRADSPSLPGNQLNPLTSGDPSALDTIETIQLQKPAK
ncbi:MAG: hypothetical protein H7Y36_06040 [Armatimonadetes bacterium]|nr:hypothetical protein [Akkermansiaceae bacterium]